MWRSLTEGWIDVDDDANIKQTVHELRAKRISVGRCIDISAYPSYLEKIRIWGWAEIEYLIGVLSRCRLLNGLSIRVDTCYPGKVGDLVNSIVNHPTLRSVTIVGNRMFSIFVSQILSCKRITRFTFCVVGGFLHRLQLPNDVSHLEKLELVNVMVTRWSKRIHHEQQEIGIPKIRVS